MQQFELRGSVGGDERQEFLLVHDTVAFPLHGKVGTRKKHFVDQSSNEVPPPSPHKRLRAKALELRYYGSVDWPIYLIPFSNDPKYK